MNITDVINQYYIHALTGYLLVIALSVILVLVIEPFPSFKDSELYDIFANSPAVLSVTYSSVFVISLVLFIVFFVWWFHSVRSSSSSVCGSIFIDHRFMISFLIHYRLFIIKTQFPFPCIINLYSTTNTLYEISKSSLDSSRI
jgi:hypothetical protein